jgi:hypothetical protein
MFSFLAKPLPLINIKPVFLAIYQAPMAPLALTQLTRGDALSLLTQQLSGRGLITKSHSAQQRLFNPKPLLSVTAFNILYLWNNTPKEEVGLWPKELFCKTKGDGTPIVHSHVWGCPAYVLDPKLQDGKSLPKWESKSRRGVFVGVSPIASLQHWWTHPQPHNGIHFPLISCCQ